MKIHIYKISLSSFAMIHLSFLTLVLPLVSAFREILAEFSPRSWRNGGEKVQLYRGDHPPEFKTKIYV